MSKLDMYTLLPFNLPTSEMTLNDLGLYAFLKSTPKTFVSNISSLSAYAEGSRSKVRTSLKNLEGLGLLSRTYEDRNQCLISLRVVSGATVPIRNRFLWNRALSLSAKGAAIAIQLLGTSEVSKLCSFLSVSRGTLSKYFKELTVKNIVRFRADGSVELLSSDKESTLVLISGNRKQSTKRSSRYARGSLFLANRVQNPTQTCVQNPTHIKNAKTFTKPSTRKMDRKSEKSNLNPFRRLPDLDSISSVSDTDHSLVRELYAFTNNYMNRHPDDAAGQYICEHTDLHILPYVLSRAKEHLSDIRNKGAYLFRILVNIFAESRTTTEEKDVFEKAAQPAETSLDRANAELADRLYKDYGNEPDLCDRCRDLSSFQKREEQKEFLKGLEQDCLQQFLSTYHEVDYRCTRMGQNYARLRRVAAFLDSPFHYARHSEEVRRVFWQVDAGEILEKLREARRLYSGYRLPAYVKEHEDALLVIESAIDAWESGERKTA